MTTRIITYLFYLLFFLTPLIWAPWNYELFEFNKMVFVYALTLVITTCWIVKMIQEKKLIFKSTPLDLPILLFLAANILSTIFSIDKHTSIFGYYSRLNGGLLSLISYLLLYYALVSNFKKEQALNFLKAVVLGGIPVSLWAIPEHFGISPSCIILTGRADASCWVQDVAARVFATLGQPNWLAAYLAMLIFPTFYFLLSSTKKSQLLTFTFCLLTFYTAFTFTYSRGATLGLLAGLVIITVTTVSKLGCNPGGFKLNLCKYILIILAIFISINLLFGSALSDFKLLNKFAPPSRPSLTTSLKGSTQLESGGTESGQIRLIVWQGAIDIFKAYPLFGSGVETFAYAYYNFRPLSHNLVSEWDFLYNKAHNEFLNYLATTGIMGFLSYMAIIGAFMYWAVKFLILNFKFLNKSKISKIQNQNFQLLTSNFHTGFLTIALLASYISYLVQNFFGFSVVNIALLFFLFPALAFLATDSLKPFKISSTFHLLPSIFYLLYHRPFYPKLAQGIVILIFGLLSFTLIKFYLADINFAKGMKFSETNPGKAYNALYQASKLNPLEPLYQSELTYQAAAAAVSLSDTQATLSANLKKQAEDQTAALLAQNPNNISYFRTAIRTYFLLSTIDPKFADKTLQTFDAALKLAPTDAKLLYNKALVLKQAGKDQEALQTLKETLRLKPNYKEAALQIKEWEKQ